MTLRVAIVVAVLCLASAADAGGQRGKLGVKRVSEFRSGGRVTSQIVDLAPGFSRGPGRSRIGRDERGEKMELDDTAPRQLQFRNKGAEGLPVTEVRTWNGRTRRWTTTKMGKPERSAAAPPAHRAAFIRPTAVTASGTIKRPSAPSLFYVQMKSVYDRRAGKVLLHLELFDVMQRPLSYRLKLPLDAFNEALETGLPIDEGPWTITADRTSLELTRDADAVEVIRIDRKMVDQVWASADREVPLAD